MKTVKNTSSGAKRVRTQNKGLTAQKKKTLECILGLCTHSIENKNCLYWNKVVDAENPAGVQYKLIIKLIGG
jgi:hypothetical protein